MRLSYIHRHELVVGFRSLVELLVLNVEFDRAPILLTTALERDRGRLDIEGVDDPIECNTGVASVLALDDGVIVLESKLCLRHFLNYF